MSIEVEDIAEAEATRRANYRAAFSGPAGEFVLAELFHLCHAGRTTYDGTERGTFINEGKRQVWLHIMGLLNATDADIWSLAMQHIDNQRATYTRRST